MSYNLAFWAGGDDLDPADTYTQLNDEQHTTGIDTVDRERIVRAFAEHLPDWTWDGQFLRPPGVDPEATPAFDVAIGDQMIEFVAYGFQNDLANAVIDSMLPLGYRLYDPQTGERFT